MGTAERKTTLTTIPLSSAKHLLSSGLESEVHYTEPGSPFVPPSPEESTRKEVWGLRFLFETHLPLILIPLLFAYTCLHTCIFPDHFQCASACVPRCLGSGSEN